jgi:hypothetical protein
MGCGSAQHATVFKARYLLREAKSLNIDEQDKRDGNQNFSVLLSLFIRFI